MSADSSPTSSDNTDSWEQWQKVYADRDLRLQLYCRYLYLLSCSFLGRDRFFNRDPNTITPVRSRSVKVMNIPLHTPQVKFTKHIFYWLFYYICILKVTYLTIQRTVLNMFKQVGNVVDSKFFYDSDHPGARCWCV